MRRFGLLATALVLSCSAPSHSSTADLAMPSHDVGTLRCQQPLDTYCAHVECIGDLATARQPATWCSDAGGPPLVYTQSCAGFTLVFTIATDSGPGWVYDTATGNLVAVLGRANTDGGCTAGPAEIELLACGGDTQICAPRDLG
jgi:hypothetical protein